MSDKILNGLKLSVIFRKTHVNLKVNQSVYIASVHTDFADSKQ